MTISKNRSEQRRCLNTHNLFFIALGLMITLVSFRAPFLTAQNFKPFTPLQVIKTEHFEIIFPEASRKSAESLSLYADGAYERVSLLLGIELTERVPVTITPDTDQFNGYCNPLPYTHIVLYDTPLSIEWTVFDNSLEKLFLHELVHAVSLNTRGSFFNFLHGLFGGFIYPAMINVPGFMVEGVTVSFESLDGFGRANDPLIKEHVRQAIWEKKFFSPFQASGAYDEMHIANGSYEYGGLFSTYLQKEYGMEKYASLWKGMGSKIRISLSYKKNGFYKIFYEVYGITFEKVWADFASSIALSNLEDNSAGTILTDQIKIQSLDSGGTKVFLLDAVTQNIFALDPSNGKKEKILTPAETAADIDVAEDGKTILVSGYRMKGTQATATTREYAVNSGKPTGKSWSGVYNARYFRDGILAIGSNLHENRIVFRDSKDSETVLLEGNATCMFSAPAPIDENRIAFIVAENGVRRVGIYDFRNGTSSIISTNLVDDKARWNYARDLRFSAGKLLFTYDSDDSTYKLALIDLDATGGPLVTFSTRNFSGGVHSPVSINDTVYYRAAFTDNDAVLTYPENMLTLNGTSAALSLSPWTAVTPELKNKTNTFGLSSFKEKKYNGLPYLNPFKAWIPLPLIRNSGNGTKFDGFGIYSMMSDPIDMNTINLTLGGDWVNSMAYFDIKWQTLNLGPPIIVQVSDTVQYSSGSEKETAARSTNGNVAIQFETGVGGEKLRFLFAPLASVVFNAHDPYDGSGAYEWTYYNPLFFGGANISLSTMKAHSWELFSKGFTLSGLGVMSFSSDLPHVEFVAENGFKLFFPIRMSVFGAWDKNGCALDGKSVVYGKSSFENKVVTEYVDEVSGNLSWITGAIAEAQILNISVQSNVTHIYVNRLINTVGWRGALYDGGKDSSAWAHPNIYGNLLMAQSLFAKAGAVVSVQPLAMAVIKIEPHVWGALKLSSLSDTTKNNDYEWGFAVTMAW